MKSSGITASTKVCAVIGNPVHHSCSPQIHNAAFNLLDLDFVYTAFEVKNIAAFMAGFKEMGNFAGLSVTIPHKISIVPFLDELDPVAEKIGSLNTVVKQDNGNVKGYGTDGYGALRALKDRGISLENARVAVIGSGGAARAVAFTLAMERHLKEVSFLGIEKDQLAGLTKDLTSLDCCHVSYTVNGGSLPSDIFSDKDLLINCSPIGMKSSDIPVPPSLLHSKLAVFDIVYTPRKTALIHEAEKMGCTTIPGEDMFINQAALQFELWTGNKAPVTAMREAFRNALNV